MSVWTAHSSYDNVHSSMCSPVRRTCDKASDAISTESCDSLEKKALLWRGLDKFGDVHATLDWGKGSIGQYAHDTSKLNLSSTKKLEQTTVRQKNERSMSAKLSHHLCLVFLLQLHLQQPNACDLLISANMFQPTCMVISNLKCWSPADSIRQFILWRITWSSRATVWLLQDAHAWSYEMSFSFDSGCLAVSVLQHQTQFYHVSPLE